MPSRYRRIVAWIVVVVLTSRAEELAFAASPAAPRSAAPRKVSIEAEDGVVVIGDYYAPESKAGETAPIAILLHMERSDRLAWKPLVPYLHAAGFAVLAIDLRGHGESVEPRGFNLTKKAADRDNRLFRAMYKDVAAAYLWLAKQDRVDPARFVLVGAGAGGSVALDYASRDRSVDAIVCLSPGLHYPGPDVAGCIRKCESRAVLLLASKVDADAANELQRACSKATVKVVPDAGAGAESSSVRGTDLLGRGNDLERTISMFLGQGIGRPATDPVIASIESDVYHVPGTSHAQRIKDENRRWFSSAAEAEDRGLRAVKKRTSKSSGGAMRQASPKPTTPPSPTNRKRSSGGDVSDGR